MKNSKKLTAPSIGRYISPGKLCMKKRVEQWKKMSLNAAEDKIVKLICCDLLSREIFTFPCCLLKISG
jgi:hypothetical protein